MKLFKSIDLYGKLPKGLAEPTNSGAVLSVFTMIALALLIFTEIIVAILDVFCGLGMGHD